MIVNLRLYSTLKARKHSKQITKVEMILKFEFLDSIFISSCQGNVQLMLRLQDLDEVPAGIA